MALTDQRMPTAQSAPDMRLALWFVASVGGSIIGEKVSQFDPGGELRKNTGNG